LADRDDLPPTINSLSAYAKRPGRVGWRPEVFDHVFFVHGPHSGPVYFICQPPIDFRFSML
jgi:hypothetical protein